jgi:hypothetical protein
MTAALPEPGAGRPVTSGEELADLLSAQHADLLEAWSRVPQLHSCAREDVFLHARRRLALHLTLESVVLGPRLGEVAQDGGPDPHLQADLDRDVVAAEAAAVEGGVECPEFDDACVQVGTVLLDHVAAQERVVMTGQLPEADRRAVESAVALWDGAGDAYLGNSWTEMVEVAEDQLAPDGAGPLTPPAGPGSR